MWSRCKFIPSELKWEAVFKFWVQKVLLIIIINNKQIIPILLINNTILLFLSKRCLQETAEEIRESNPDITEIR